MREIITIQVGQGGIQVGNACWELFCLEHQIQPNGQMINQQVIEKDDALRTFFSESDHQKLVPRSVLLDLEPTLINQVKTGKFKEMFKPEQFVSGKGGAAHNFGRGHYSIGREYIDICLERIRKIVDNCSSFQGFMMLNSVGGGTGSGLGTLLLEKLSVDYCKKSRLSITIYPSPETSEAMVEPYNSIFATSSLLEHSEVCIAMDNQALYDICKNGLGVETPKYSNLNRIIAQAISSITASIRFDGALFTDITEIQTSLIPYPKLQFLICSQAPITSHQIMDNEKLSTFEITKLAFEAENMMAKCDPRQGKFLSCSLIYRGDIIPKDICYSISQIKTQKTIRFVDWCPTGFRVGINYQAQQALPEDDLCKSSRSACMIANTTALSQIFSKLSQKYDLMFAKRAFVHWYVQEGMEEAQFFEAREALAGLQKDYEEVDQNIIEEDEGA
ncbi:unnamed protein product (macronuclear) [Paramecium tetraurelia]|uniref:Tubulin alpha chain n=1 Tax=Paramecium tetraurelia TaxID=5888 RepID=Q3SEH4_PARTE|nr:uncharacterized protein GSPATT00034751001 [Paramecium tetraurelia]CAI38950.1 alpha_tubulin,putative [Paramecium tetraurelia]CAK65272.1 unnamed protein product [Paramecium tetraurelia]|eukprot:XP_001432669.1 hypothetical protein (macronuclear) [Paramecium tetraurelia strain d4-2]